MARDRQEARINSTRTRKEQILDRCGGICCHCGKEITIGSDFSVEHVVPLSKGGSLKGARVFLDLPEELTAGSPLAAYNNKEHVITKVAFPGKSSAGGYCELEGAVSKQGVPYCFDNTWLRLV